MPNFGTVNKPKITVDNISEGNGFLRPPFNMIFGIGWASCRGVGLAVALLKPSQQEATFSRCRQRKG